LRMVFLLCTGNWHTARSPKNSQYRNAPHKP
jgi:hypothetical protein